jgi:hypothetical protein
MSTFIDNLNLRPQEKRIIVVLGVAAFLVLNLVFVRPHFNDYGKMSRELDDARKSIGEYSAKIAADENPTNGYKVVLRGLLKQEGGSSTNMFSSDIALQKSVSEKAGESKVSVQQYDPVNLVRLGTNAASQFFESQSIRISVSAREEDLVNFLYNVGNDPAMIRVQELDLHPFDANRYQLKGQITLTADYKKNKETSVKPATTNKVEAAPIKLAPAAKPAPKPTPAPTPTPAPAPQKVTPPPAPPSNVRGRSTNASPPPFPTLPPRPVPSPKPAGA